MDSKEVQDEIISMKVPHGAIPGAGDGSKEEKAGEEMDVGHFPEVFLVDEEEKGSKAGKEKADGPLGEGGKGRSGVAEEIVFPVFCIAQVEEGNGCTHEEEESGVCDDCFGKEPAFYGQGKDEGREPANLFAIHFPSEPEGEEDGKGTCKGSRKAGRHFVPSEEKEGKGELPIVENRFIVPVAAVDLRRDPVP